MPQDTNDVIRLICKRVIRKLNKSFDSNAISDDLPTQFSFFDALSIWWQTKTFDEIIPGLQDLIEGYLEDETDKISKKEKVFLEEDYPFDENNGYSLRDKDIYDSFVRMLDDHYSLQKIQKFMWNF